MQINIVIALFGIIIMLGVFGYLLVNHMSVKLANAIKEDLNEQIEVYKEESKKKMQEMTSDYDRHLKGNIEELQAMWQEFDTLTRHLSLFEKNFSVLNETVGDKIALENQIIKLKKIIQRKVNHE